MCLPRKELKDLLYDNEKLFENHYFDFDAVKLWSACNGCQGNLLLNFNFVANSSETQIIKQIEKGVDLNQVHTRTGLTPLTALVQYRAAVRGKPKSAVHLMKIYLEAGADPNLQTGIPKDKDYQSLAGVSTLYLATVYYFETMVATLLDADAGADSNLPVRWENRTPLIASLLPSNENYPPPNENIVRMLLEAGADPTTPEEDGDTPISLTAEGRDANPEIHQMLLDARK